MQDDGTQVEQGTVMHHRATINREGSCLDDRRRQFKPLILARLSSLVSAELLTLVRVKIHCIFKLAVLSTDFNFLV